MFGKEYLSLNWNSDFLNINERIFIFFVFFLMFILTQKYIARTHIFYYDNNILLYIAHGKIISSKTYTIQVKNYHNFLADKIIKHHKLKSN